MSGHPTGTVTFLFTDVEGSTQLWEHHHDWMEAAHHRHEAMLREAIAANGGWAYKQIGDAFQAAFQTAPQALAAAVAAQQALTAEAWQGPGPIKVRMALWDIKGKIAGLPVYDLLGGKCREAALVYRHADGRDPQEVLDNVLKYRDDGYRAVRCQLGGYGGRVQDIRQATALPNRDAPQATHRGPVLERLDSAFPGAYYDPDRYARSIPALFEHVRAAVGFDLLLLHDIHERLAPIDAIRMAKALEPYRLFFLEDPLAPDQIEWFRRLREQCTTPIAMGELHVNPLEWRPLVAEQLIDFIRAHISAIGGLTPARKLAALAEAFGVRTAWHGPGDVSPVGHAANLHLDLACHNFGVQEVISFGEPLYEVFSGIPELRNGHLWANDAPGWGVDIDEAKAAKYPITVQPVEWTQSRWPDGTLWTP